MQKFGIEAERHLFRSLLSYIDFSSDNANNKDIAQVRIMVSPLYNVRLQASFDSKAKPSASLMFNKLLRVNVQDTRAMCVFQVHLLLMTRSKSFSFWLGVFGNLFTGSNSNLSQTSLSSILNVK